MRRYIVKETRDGSLEVLENGLIFAAGPFARRLDALRVAMALQVLEHHAQGRCRVLWCEPGSEIDHALPDPSLT